MPRVIRQGDTFEVTSGGRVDKFRREPDDSAPIFESTRILVTHLECSMDPNVAAKPYTFGTEQEWFRQRGLEADE